MQAIINIFKRTRFISILIIFIIISGAFPLIQFPEQTEANQGGPDLLGYKWTDSLGPTPTVPYAFLDGITNGKRLHLAVNQNTDWIELGFTFNYYGQDYDRVALCSNGWMSFVDNSSISSQGDVPDTALPHGVIAAYWKNLHSAQGGGIYYYQANYTYPHKFIVTWAAVPLTGTTNYQTFQIILNELNEIWFQYYSITFIDKPEKDRPQIGIEQPSGSVGLDYPTDLISNMSIRFWKQLRPRLIITEIQDSGAGGERIEVSNVGAISAAISNYRLSVNQGASYLSGGSWSTSFIPPGGHSYYTTTGNQLDDEAGVVSLYNFSATNVVNEVGYGWEGTAPDPLSGESVARYVDNGEYTIDWTRSSTSSFGTQNSVVKVNNNPEVVLNEVLFNPGNSTSFIELNYLGTGASFDLTGYKIVCDSVYTIPSATLNSEKNNYILKSDQFPAGFDLTAQADNIYLYSSTGELLDMVGWSSAHAVDGTISRVPDGNGSYKGYNDVSSAIAGWKFDVAPTMALLCIGPDQTKLCEFGGKVFYDLAIINSAVTDTIDLTYVSSTTKCNFNLYYKNNMTLLKDTDNDNIIDTGQLTPSQKLELRFEVYIPDDVLIGTNELTTLYATSSNDTEIRDHVFLNTYTYPHLEAAQYVAPTHIYSENIPGLNYTVIELNVTGFGGHISIKVPQDTIFLIDSSSSMSNSDPDFLRVEASKRYVDKLKVPDRTAVVDFDDDAILVNNDHLSTNYATIKQNLDTIDSVGTTFIGPPIEVANDEFKTYGNPNHEWVQILLTDGGANDYKKIFEETWEASNFSIRIFTIGLGYNADVYLLYEIANQTGGEFFFAPTADALDDIYDAISQKILNLAGKDENLQDKDTMIKYVLPNYLHYDPTSFSSPPKYIDNNPNGSTVLYWNVPRINLTSSKVVTFNVSSSKTGYVPVCLLPDSRIHYTSWNNTDKVMPFQQHYIWVEDITPLPVKLTTSSDDKHVYLNWTEPISLEPKHYLIYRSTTQNGFEFASPFANTYTDISTVGGAVDPLGQHWIDLWANDPENDNFETEYYYCVVVVNRFDMKSVTSNIAGKWTVEFQEGVNTYSLPLEPFEQHYVSWYQDQILDCYYIKWLDPETDNWVKHLATDPEGVNDTIARIGEGNELYLNQTSYFTVCGLPATSVRYLDTKLSAPSDFTLAVVNDDVHLSWQTVAGADYYFIYRTTTRDGFAEPILTPLKQLDANSGTQFVDMGVITDDCEYIYSLAAVRTSELDDYALNLGYSIGVRSITYTIGYNSLALPLKPFENYTADWFCKNIDGTLGVNWLDQNGDWLGHAEWMPSGVYDAEIKMATGYQLCISNNVQVNYIGI